MAAITGHWASNASGASSMRVACPPMATLHGQINLLDMQAVDEEGMVVARLCYVKKVTEIHCMEFGGLVDLDDGEISLVSRPNPAEPLAFHTLTGRLAPDGTIRKLLQQGRVYNHGKAGLIVKAGTLTRVKASPSRLLPAWDELIVSDPDHGSEVHA